VYSPIHAAGHHDNVSGELALLRTKWREAQGEAAASKEEARKAREQFQTLKRALQELIAQVAKLNARTIPRRGDPMLELIPDLESEDDLGDVTGVLPAELLEPLSDD
jgi:hypothetical protein